MSTWYNTDHSIWPSAMSGGLLAPQFSTFDLDLDGTYEVIVFDRFSGIIQVWTWEGIDIAYSLNLDLPIDWPQLQSWMLVRDYNNDHIPDLFSQGLHGISVYKGIKNGNKIRFEKQSGESFIDDSLVFKNKFGSKTNIYHAESDIPIIEDVDEDGDLDIMTFDISGSYLYYYENMWNNSGNHLDFSLKHNCWGYFAENQFSEDINLGNEQLNCPPPYTIRHAGSTSCIIDVNLDSIPDLLIGDIGGNSLNVLINSGRIDTGFISKKIPSFPDQASPALLRYFPAAYKIDINQDNTNDILISVNDYPVTDSEGIWAYTGTLNDVQPFELKTKQWLYNQYIDLGQYTSPYFMNINGDDLPDLLISYQISKNEDGPQNKIAYFEALGTNSYQLNTLDFGSLSSNLTIGNRPYITSGDVDDDGDQDILIGMSNGTTYLVSNSSGENNRFSPDNIVPSWEGLELLSGATPEFFDIDGDGDLDLISGSDNGSIGLYINTGDKAKAIFISDLSLFPNIEKLGQVQTIGQNSLLGRSAPRIIHFGGDTILISGSNQGNIFTYKVNTRALSSDFDQIEIEGWPNWLGGNARVTLGANDQGESRLIAGNIAGGLIEKSVPWDVTSSSVPTYYNFNIYPNPVLSGQDLNVIIDKPDQIKRINIISPTGTLFHSTIASGNDMIISTAGLLPGLYILQIVMVDRSSIFQKVIVQ